MRGGPYREVWFGFARILSLILRSFSISLQNLACHSRWHQLLVRKPQLGSLTAGVAVSASGEGGRAVFTVKAGLSEQPRTYCSSLSLVQFRPAQLRAKGPVGMGRRCPPLSLLLKVPPTPPTP